MLVEDSEFNISVAGFLYQICFKWQNERKIIVFRWDVWCKLAILHRILVSKLSLSYVLFISNIRAAPTFEFFNSKSISTYVRGIQRKQNPSRLLKINKHILTLQFHAWIISFTFLLSIFHHCFSEFTNNRCRSFPWLFT